MELSDLAEDAAPAKSVLDEVPMQEVDALIQRAKASGSMEGLSGQEKRIVNEALHEMSGQDAVEKEREAQSTRGPASVGMTLDDLASPEAPKQEKLTLDDLAHDQSADVAQDAQARMKEMGWQPFPEPQQINASPVGTIMRGLNKPLNFVAGRVAAVIPGAKAKLNPNGDWFPDLTYTDVIDYMAPDGGDIAESLSMKGYDPNVSAAIGAAYQTVKFTAGMAANIFGDPLFLLNPKIGTLTRGAEELYKAGKVGEAASKERNLLTLDVPFVKKEAVTIPLAPVAGAIKNGAATAAAAIEKVPGGSATLNAASKSAEVAHDFIRSLDYRTGVDEIDLAASQHAGLKRGDQFQIANDFALPLRQKNFTESELGLISDVTEATPNVRPGGIEYPKQEFSTVQGPSAERPVLADKGARARSSIASQYAIGRNEAEVQGHVARQIEQLAKAKKLTLPAGRADDIAEAVMSIKRENAKDISERISAGLLDKEDVATKTIRNYLAHEISPQARKYLRNPKLAAAVEEANQTQRLRTLTKGTYVSSFDSSRYSRTIRKPLQEANDIMKAKTEGKVTDWFITDPIAATALKRLETRKLIRDSELMETIAKYGQRRGKIAGNPAFRDWQKIDHPELRGKSVIIRDGEKVVATKIDDLMFPREIAQKISYYIVPREVGNFHAFMDSYNRVFRNFALARADYYIQNWGENFMKNYVQGVKLDDYVDTSALLSGAQGTIKVGGREVSLEAMRKEIEGIGLKTGGQFHEGLEPTLNIGKKYIYDETVRGRIKAGVAKTGERAKNLMQGVRNLGEHGENYTRVAMYLNRRKAGFIPEMAAFEVEKYLFDFSRNSKTVDIARRYYQPFIQAAVKTAFIAPEMLGKSPAAYNFVHNNLLRTMEKAMHDPVESWSIKQLYPGYVQIQDRIAGPMLPGNHWLAALAGYGPQKQQMPYVAALGLPVGVDILNQFMIFDGRILKQAVSAGPLFSSLSMFFYGQDPFTGKDLDLTKDTASVSRRLRAAVTNFVEAPIAMPNLTRSLKQRFGIGDPDYYEPDTIAMMHAEMGKFGRVVNLDKEFHFKMIALIATRKQLVSRLWSAASKEFTGKTADLSAVPTAAGRAAVNLGIGKDWSNVEVYQKLVQNSQDAAKVGMAQQYLAGNMSAQAVAAMIRNIDQNVKDMNESYQTMSARYLEMARGYRQDQLDDFANRMSAEFEAKMKEAIKQKQ
jgi:hypothetical protein